MKNRVIAAAMTAALSMAAAGQAAATSTPAITFDALSGGALLDGEQTVGWEFAVGPGVTVDKLGVFDDSQNGLFNDHEVGIWNIHTQQLVASATVHAGTGDELINQFRYVDITPVNLLSGQVYVVGALYVDSRDRLAPDFPGNRLDAPPIEDNGGDQGPVDTDTLVFPFGGPGLGALNNYGPNFTILTGGVPEPAAWTLMLGGFGLAGAALRGRRRNAPAA